MLGIKADNNFTLQFMLYKKSAHGIIFILLSFSGYFFTGAGKTTYIVSSRFHFLLPTYPDLT